jgi:hypothetical protein
MEARAGIEPACEDLQSSTSPLRHRAILGWRAASATRQRASQPSSQLQCGEMTDFSANGLAAAGHAAKNAKDRYCIAVLEHLCHKDAL